MQKAQLPDDVKAYLRNNPQLETLIDRVLGGEITQVRLSIYSRLVKDISIYGGISNHDEWVNAWEDLSCINRSTAFRLLAYLPDPVIHVSPDHWEKETLSHLRLNYVGYSAWLLSWDRQWSTMDLVTSGLSGSQLYAVCSKRRLDFIQGLFDLGYFSSRSIYPKPSFVWLLSEVSLCIAGLRGLGIQYPRNSDDSPPKTSKRESYEFEKFRIELLEGCDIYCGKRVEATTSNVFENFSAVVEEVARLEAKTNYTFYCQYWKPYISALTAYNAATLGPNFRLLTNATPKRRGRQLGNSKTVHGDRRNKEAKGKMLSNVN